MLSGERLLCHNGRKPSGEKFGIGVVVEQTSSPHQTRFSGKKTLLRGRVSRSFREDNKRGM